MALDIFGGKNVVNVVISVVFFTAATIGGPNTVNDELLGVNKVSCL